MMVILEVTLGLVLGIIILALLPALLRGAAFLAGVLILVALATAAAWLIADNWPYSLYFSVGIAVLGGLCTLTHVKRWDTRYSRTSRDGA